MLTSRLTCTFCAHCNPEGSSFCNRCGAPLNLAPCPQCEAINNVADLRCYACGATLAEAAAEELALAGPVEAAEADEPSSRGPMPGMTLRHRLDDIEWQVRSREPATETVQALPPAPVERAAGEPEVGEADGAASYAARRSMHSKRSSRWAKRIVFGCALVAIAGAIAWSTLQVPQRWVDVLTRAVAPAPPPSVLPAPAPSVSQPPASNAPQPDASNAPQPDASNAPPSSASSAPPSPASSGPSAPMSTAPALPPATATPAPVEASTPAPAPVSETPAAPVATHPDNAGASKAASTPAPGSHDRLPAAVDARRRANPGTRTHDQAMRDALATQRLIERDLGLRPRPADRAREAPRN